MKRIFNILVFIFVPFFLYAQTDKPTAEQLKKGRWLSLEEWERRSEVGRAFQVTDPPVGPIMNIAEFQPMQGVMVRYPFGIPISLVKEMAKVAKVTTIVSNTNQQTTVTNTYISNGVDMDNVDFMIAPTDSYWTRDYGPWFIIDGNDEFGIVDFPYNRPRPNDNNIASKAAEFYGTNLFGMNMLQTGGNYMTDGYGVSASTDLVIEENPSMTETQLQQMAKNYLGVDPYYLIDDPLAEYIKHIDCWGKFLGVDKVLIGQVPTSDPRYANYESVAAWFENTTTPWGNKYRVYRVYTPGNGYQATAYTNSLILNDHVFVPISGNQYDAQAITAYQEAMPGYTIVPVMQANSTAWENTDALHCRTHEIADLGMLLIKHHPLLGQQMATETYTIQADITAYSGEAFVEDSMLIFYKINDSEWKTRPLTHVSEKTWEGEIPCVTENDEVSYYIFAKDESGRRECHPYIGKHDPHIFSAQSTTIPEPIIAIEEKMVEEDGLNNDDHTFNITINNEGCADLTFELSESGEVPAKDFSLLSFEPQSGIIGTGKTQTIAVTAHTKDIPADIYATSILVSSNDYIFSEIEIPVNIEVFNGLMAPDTIFVVQNEVNPVFFTVSSDYKSDIRLNDIQFAHGASFDGTIAPADGSEFPVTIPSSQEVIFKAEYTGNLIGHETFFSTYTLMSDVMNRDIVVAFTIDAVGIDEQQNGKQSISVFPNPATNSVSFEYTLTEPTSAIISMYDITGKLIKQELKSNQTSGKQMVTWNLENETMLSGIYLYTIQTEQQLFTGKLLILK